MSGLALLCSGQSGQHAGMFAITGTAPEASPEATRIFEAASRHLDGTDPRAFVERAAPDRLFANRAGQILCCTQALAAHAMLRDALPDRIVLAGYSVGELAAYGLAGVFAPEALLDLAAARAAWMDRATPDASGLAAISGLNASALRPILAAHALHVAIVNGPDAFVIGGANAGLDAAMEAARASGATTARRLPVAIPSHTALLAPAAEAFRRTLADTPGKPPARGTRLLSALDGATVRDTQTGLDRLARQISETVHWSDTMRACVEAGCDRFLELGPGQALARIADHAAPGTDIRALEQFRTADGVRDWLAKGARD